MLDALWRCEKVSHEILMTGKLICLLSAEGGGGGGAGAGAGAAGGRRGCHANEGNTNSY